MKKILTVSLVAMMAVSAARADIASTKYVDDKTGNVAASEYVSGLTNKTLTGAVENLNSRIDDISGESGILAELDLTAVTEAGKAIVSVSQENGQVAATTGEIGTAGIANESVTLGKLSTEVQASLGKADTAMQSIGAGTVTKTMLESTVQTSLGKADTAMQSIGAGTVTKTMLDSDVQASLDAADAAAGGITTAIEALDVTDTAVEKQFVTAVSETDGKVVVSRAALTAADIPTIEQSQVNGLGAALSGKQATLGAGDITTGLIADANVTKAKLSEAVQESLDKADSALQSIEDGTVTKAMLASTVQTSLGLADSALPTADFNSFKTENTNAIATAKSEAIADAASKYQVKALVTSQAEMNAAANKAAVYPSASLMESFVNDKTTGLVTGLGDVDNLETTAENVVGAINEVKDTADSALAKAEANEDAIDGLGALARKSTIATADIDAKAVTLEKLADGVQTSLGLANSAVQSVTTGTGNGNINVDGTQVAVSGLKSAAFAETTAFDSVGSAATAKSEAIAAAKTETESQISALGLTAVSKVAVPTECENGQATCALVYDSVAKDLKWEAIMK